MFGERPQRTFKEAATRYLKENLNKRSINDELMHINQLNPFIGNLALEQIHVGTLQAFVNHRKKKGVKNRSVNLALGVVRHILNIAASEWLNEHGLTWLHSAPKIIMLSLNDAAKPYPLSWEEQKAPFSSLPNHLAVMALFKVNTGTREQEVCQLQWKWEYRVPEICTSVFIVPGNSVKNGEDRVIVLNSVARSIVDTQRGKHEKYVFPYKENPIGKMNNSGWKMAWKKAELPHNDQYKRGVHNLKHTFGRRLRAAGVSHEDRQVLLGHRNGSITTHYSAPEIENLINAANKVCEERRELTLLKVVS